MSELLWFPNHPDSLVSISYSQCESLDAPLPAMPTPAPPPPRRSLKPNGLAFVAGGGTAVQRTPTTVKTQQMTTPREEKVERTPLAPKVVQAQATPQNQTPTGLSSALKQAKARQSTSPKNVLIQQMATQANVNKENFSPAALLDGSKLDLTTEYLSPLRFPTAAAPPMSNKPATETKNTTTQQGFSISASPLAVSLADSSFHSGAVPLNWTTPVRSRKSLTAPTSADPRVEAIKERVQSLLKSKRKSLATPMITPRAAGTERIEVMSQVEQLTPYSAAVEQTLQEQGTPSQWDCVLDTSEHQSASIEEAVVEQEEVESPGAAVAVEQEEFTQITPEQQGMETVLEEESTEEASHPSSSSSTPVSPVVEKSSSILTASPLTLVKADREMFSRELIAAITTPAPVVKGAQIQMEATVMKMEFQSPLAPAQAKKKNQKHAWRAGEAGIEAKAVTEEKQIIAALTQAPVTIQTLEEKLARVNNQQRWNLMRVLLSVLMIAMFGTAGFFAAFHINQPIGPASPAVDIQPVAIETSIPVAPISQIPVTHLPKIEAEIVAPDQITPVAAVVEEVEEVQAEVKIETVTEVAVPVVEIATEAPAVVVEEVAPAAVEELVAVEPVQVDIEAPVVFEASIEPAVEVVVVEQESAPAIEVVETATTAPVPEAVSDSVAEIVQPAIEPAVEAVPTEPAAPAVESIVVESGIPSDPSSLITTWTWSPEEVMVEEDLFAMPFSNAPTPMQQPLRVVIHKAEEVVAEKEPVAVETIPEPVAVIVEEAVVAPVEIASATVSVPAPVEAVPAVIEEIAVEPVVEAVAEATVEAVVEPIVAPVAESVVEPVISTPSSIPSSSTTSSWSTGWIVTGLVSLCIIGGWLQSMEAAVGETLAVEKKATSPARVAAQSSSPFSFTSSATVSTGEATPFVSSRPSLSPIRPLRKIHFTPTSADRPSPSPAAFSTMASRLDAAEPALQAMASALAQDAAKKAKHVPANASIGSPALRASTTAPVEANRLHVDVPMIIPPRVASTLAPPAPVVEAPTKTRTSRRTTQQTATLQVNNTPAVETRKSTRLSRRA